MGSSGWSVAPWPSSSSCWSCLPSSTPETAGLTRPASRPSRRAVLLGLPLVPLALQGCAAPSVWASDEAVAQAYAPVTGETALTLFTMKNSGSDNGAHTALMIEADQRVIFDPAGSFETAALPERNDLIYGVTEQVAEVYVSFHARDDYYVVAQRVAVPPETAQAALALAQQAGPVPRTRCTIATGRLLQQLPGFEGIRPALQHFKLCWAHI